MGERDAEPNRHLAAVMCQAGISNKGLGRRVRELSGSDGGNAPVRADHVQVSRWLAGRHPQPRTCRLIARALAEKLGRRVTLEEIGYGKVATGQDTGLEYPADVAASVTALGQLAHNDLHDPTISGLTVVPDAWNTVLVRWLVDSDHGQSGPPVNPRAVTATDVDAIRDATVMFGNYDYKFGGGRPKLLIAKFLEIEILPHLPHISPTDPVGREYYREVAALIRLAGWTAYDAGAHGQAQRYLTQAFRIAKAANDKALCGRILAGMSHQANFLGHYQLAVDLAAAAHRGALGYTTPTMVALFLAMKARAHASLGQEAETTAALLTAERHHAQGEPANDPMWIRYFDRAELHAEFAHCFRDLNKPELANHHAAASVQESSNLYVRSLSFCRTVLATSYLQNNDVEQALAVASTVVDTAATLQSSRVLSYIADFRARLDAICADEPITRGFNEYADTRLPSKRAPMPRRLVVL
jgi:hypothetical protein